MAKGQWRLKGGEIEEVLRKGRSKSNHFFTIKFLPSDEGGRFAIIVGRALGCAVRRNKLKRRLREILRSRIKNEGLKFKIVLLARDGEPKATGLSFAQLQEEVDKLLIRAGILER